MPAPGRKKEVGRARVIDGVAIAPVSGGKAGMPVEGHFARSKYPHAGGQPTIEGARPAIGGNGTGRVEMHHLAGSMNPCIGAAGRHGTNRTMRV